MTDPHAYARTVHNLLEEVFSDPRTWGYFRHDGTTPEQTIDGVTQLTRDPEGLKSESKFDFPRPVRVVENGGRGAQ